MKRKLNKLKKKKEIGKRGRKRKKKSFILKKLNK